MWCGAGSGGENRVGFGVSGCRGRLRIRRKILDGGGLGGVKMAHKTRNGV